MIVRVNAARWDRPLDVEASVVEIRTVDGRPNDVIVSTDTAGRARFQLGPWDESIEILPSTGEAVVRRGAMVPAWQVPGAVEDGDDVLLLMDPPAGSTLDWRRRVDRLTPVWVADEEHSDAPHRDPSTGERS